MALIEFLVHEDKKHLDLAEFMLSLHLLKL